MFPSQAMQSDAVK